MKIEINGNPGTGNTFTEVHIGHIENSFPNVKAVNIIKDGSSKTTTIVSEGDDNSPKGHPLSADRDKEAKRQDILKYVGQTLPLVRYGWKDRYMNLWEDILNLPDVDAVIYRQGRQQHTSFNRKEVLHIICYLGKHADGGIGIFERNYVASNVALQLADGCEKTTRPDLGFKPEKSIQCAIDELMNSPKYQNK